MRFGGRIPQEDSFPNLETKVVEVQGCSITLGQVRSAGAIFWFISFQKFKLTLVDGCLKYTLLRFLS